MFTTAFLLNPYLFKIKKEKHNTDTSGDINNKSYNQKQENKRAIMSL